MYVNIRYMMGVRSSSSAIDFVIIVVVGNCITNGGEDVKLPLFQLE